MKHLNAKKYNLAWFKLAECVSRREKERALGVYRLLSHSVGNDALAKQLFGDLLLCFEEKEDAIQQYKQAAQMYKNQNKHIESIAVYEHLITLNSDDKEDIFDLCDLYARTQLPHKIVFHIDNLLKNNKLDFVLRIVKKHDDLFDSADALNINQELSFALMRDKTRSREVIIGQLEKTLDKFLMIGQEEQDGESVGSPEVLNEYLIKVELEDESFHKHACKYLEKI